MSAEVPPRRVWSSTTNTVALQCEPVMLQDVFPSDVVDIAAGARHTLFLLGKSYCNFSHGIGGG